MKNALIAIILTILCIIAIVGAVFGLLWIGVTFAPRLTLLAIIALTVCFFSGMFLMGIRDIKRWLDNRGKQQPAWTNNIYEDIRASFSLTIEALEIAIHTKGKNSKEIEKECKGIFDRFNKLSKPYAQD